MGVGGGGGRVDGGVAGWGEGGCGSRTVRDGREGAVSESSI